MPDLYLAFPQGRRKALTLSYDDGVEQDARLMDIMAKHGLKGTFNLSSGLYAPEGHAWPEGQVHRRFSHAQATRLYGESGQEVAIHAFEHADLAMLQPSAMAWQVLKDKEALEAQFGCIIRGMAYPYGRTTPEVARTLQGCGIAYARTVTATHGFDLPMDWLRLPATCHHDDPQLMALARRFVEKQPAYQPWLFYLWGHSYEFEAHDNWQVIEAFAALTGGREDVWYATNIQVHDYVEAWRHLVTSADGRRLWNPTALTLWARKGEHLWQIGPGETVCIA